MLSIDKAGPGRVARLYMLLIAISCLAQYAAADTELPKSAFNLSPASVELEEVGFIAYDPDEFGNVIISRRNERHVSRISHVRLCNGSGIRTQPQ